MSVRSTGGIAAQRAQPGIPEVRRLGLIPYAPALEAQIAAADALRREPGAPEIVFVLQHPTVITLGRSADRSHVRADDGTLKKLGIEVVSTDRGGDVTLHAPGQVVLYPILHLGRRRLGPARFVELLEEAMIETCRSFGVAASRFPPHPGVWVPKGRLTGIPSKIGAVGLRISVGVTTHGIALNVSNDLSLFGTIVPCGLAGTGVTSVEVEIGRHVDVGRVEDALLWAVRSELEDAARTSSPPPVPRRPHTGGR